MNKQITQMTTNNNSRRKRCRSNSDNEQKLEKGREHYASLWPLILYRALNTMKLSSNDGNRTIFCDERKQTVKEIAVDDDRTRTTGAENTNSKSVPSRLRRENIVYYLLLNGTVADL